MADVEITPEAAESYIHAVAVALDAAGYTLPSAVLYWFDEDGPTGGITLLDAIQPHKDDLGLSWELSEGWSAGYPHPEGGLELVEDLLLDVAPPPWRVVAAVKAIAKSGCLAAGIAESARYPVELLPLYEPAAEGLVQAAADAVKARAATLRGTAATSASETGLITSMVTPAVAAVYAKVRGRLAGAEQAERERAEAVERLLGDLERGRAKFQRERASAETAWEEAGRFAKNLTFVETAIETWDAGDAAPHDVLVAIRDQLAGRIPGEPTPDQSGGGR